MNMYSVKFYLGVPLKVGVEGRSLYMCPLTTRVTGFILKTVVVTDRSTLRSNKTRGIDRKG